MTKDSKHTPGPWFVSKSSSGTWTISAPRWSDFATVFGTGPEEGRHNDANARLIAAAPELLAALEQIADHVTKSDTWELKRIARAAIARVEEGSK